VYVLWPGLAHSCDLKWLLLAAVEVGTLSQQHGLKMWCLHHNASTDAGEQSINAKECSRCQTASLLAWPRCCSRCLLVWLCDTA
jgi:hypothetical protein